LLKESSENNLLSINSLKTYFPTSKGLLKAVDRIHLYLRNQEAVGLVGESGSGKSMTAFSIINLLPNPGRIFGGQIYFKGQDLLKCSEKEMINIRGDQISMIFQDPLTYLNPTWRIKDQIAETLFMHKKITKKDAYINTINLLKSVNIPAPERVAHCYPHELSGGMKQRALIAMALACNPSLLIADEPTTALDVTVQSQIIDLLKDLMADYKTSLLLITHDLGIVSEICDRIYVMYAGRIVEEGDIYELFNEPLHPYTQGLLKSILSVDEFKEDLATIDGNVPDLTAPPLGCNFHPRCNLKIDICMQKDPSMISLGGKHTCACWLYIDRDKNDNSGS